MASDLDAAYLRRLNNFENRLAEHLLHASNLTALTEEWLQLVDELQPAIDSDSLSISTVSLVEAMTEKISSIIADSAKARQTEDDFLEKACPRADSKPPRKPSKKLCASAHVKPSYEWLVKNLHNPYPSNSIRQKISQSSACSRKDVDSWFVEARRRIGWNDLRKRFFDNKRANIVAAATTTFLQGSSPASQDPAVHLEFATIKKKTRQLYRKAVTEQKPLSLPKSASQHARRMDSSLDSVATDSPGADLNSQPSAPKKRKHDTQEDTFSEGATKRKRVDVKSANQPTVGEEEQHGLRPECQWRHPEHEGRSPNHSISGSATTELDNNSFSDEELPGLSFSDTSFSSTDIPECTTFDNWFQPENHDFGPLSNTPFDASANVNVELGQIPYYITCQDWASPHRDDLNVWSSYPDSNYSSTTDQLWPVIVEGSEQVGDRLVATDYMPHTSVDPVAELPHVDWVTSPSPFSTSYPDFQETTAMVGYTPSTGLECAKAVKVKQLREMKDAISRLEQEIALFA